MKQIKNNTNEKKIKKNTLWVLINDLKKVLKAEEIKAATQRLLRKYFLHSFRELPAGLGKRFEKISPKSWKVARVTVTAVLVISGSLFYFENYATAAYIVIDGQQIGLVASVTAGESLVQAVLQEAGQPLGQISKTDHKIDYSRTWVGMGALRAGSLSAVELKAWLAPYVDGYAIKVGGEEVAEVQTLQDADKVLTDLKNYYVQPDDSQKITSVKFQESVTTEMIKAQPENVEAPAQVLAMLEKGKEIDKEYTVQADDSLWLIARKNDMLTKEVVSGNPGLTEKSAIKPGQKLRLVSFVPYLTVIGKGEYTNTETIPFDVITKTDYNLGNGKTQIKAPGSEGSKEVTYSFVEKNGKITERNVLKENITKQPVDRVIAKGPNVSVARKPVQMASSQVQISRGGADKVQRMIDNALSLQGIPYLWGGTTRNGFDCSGFVQYVFKSSGIALPRTSFEQYKVGVPVSRDNLQPGDLVFFNTYARASDVRIYIGGGLTVGSSSDGVSIHSLSESYWSRHYLGARRISIN